MQRGLLVVALTASMAIAILPVISLGVLAPFLIADLGISRVDLGLLVALASGVSAVLSPGAGLAVDRIGDRRALLLVFVTGSVSLACMAGASDPLTMALALSLSGLCQAGSNPATNSMISARVAPGRRGWITGIKQSGETLAITLGASLLPGMALVFGWRVALLVLSGLAALVFAVVALSLEGSPRTGSTASGRSSKGMRPSIYWLSAYSFAMGAAGGSVTAYLPLYAYDVGDLGVAAAGSVLVVAGAVGGVSRILWSRWTEAKLGLPVALVALAGLAVLSGILLLAAPVVGPAGFWTAAGLWGASGLAFGSVAMLAVITESDGSTIGRASGLAVFGFGVGLTCTPPLFGWLVDRGHGYGFGFAIVIGFYVLAVAIILVGRTSFRSTP